MKKMIIALFCGAVSLNAFAGGDANRGAELTRKFNCASCHGADFKSPIDPSYPKIAGQYEDYIVHALTAYKRGNGNYGRNNPIMGGMAQPLTDRDMADIAAYISSLPSELTSHR
jgi:cytochrome c553